jgi:glycosyltransferase involved in cell wall biosynthesis
MSIPCTVQILTKNSASTLANCLDALQDFQEIIVQDGGSTDGTREIALRYPNVVLLDQDPLLLTPEGKIADFAAMRNRGIAHALFPWIFIVDSNEPVSTALSHEVMKAVQGEPAAYSVFRRFYLHDEPIAWCARYPALQIRLFHRSCTSGYIKAVHERLILFPHTHERIFSTELKEILPPLSVLPSKFAYYRSLECKRVGILSWCEWRYLLFRNTRSCLGISLRLLRIWCLPRTGKRMPLAYEFSHMRQLCLLIYELFPPIARQRRAPKK